MITIKVYKGSNTSSEFKTYNLNNDKLKSFETYNDFMSVNEKGEYTIERWIHINEYGGYKIEKKIETGKIENFSLYEGINVIEIDLRRSQTEIIYIIENPYTKAMGVEIKNKIQINNQGIMQEVSKKVGKDEIISRINQSPEEIKLKASKIKFEGMVTANNNVSIDENGFIKAKGIFDERGSFTILTSPGYRKSVKANDTQQMQLYDCDFCSIDFLYEREISPEPDGTNVVQDRIMLTNGLHLEVIMPAGFTPTDMRVQLSHKPKKWYDRLSGDFICEGNTKGACLYSRGDYNTFDYSAFERGDDYLILNTDDQIKKGFGDKEYVDFNGYQTVMSKNLINDLVYDKDTTKVRNVKVVIAPRSPRYRVGARLEQGATQWFPNTIRNDVLPFQGILTPQIIVMGYYKDIGGN